MTLNKYLGITSGLTLLAGIVLGLLPRKDGSLKCGSFFAPDDGGTFGSDAGLCPLLRDSLGQLAVLFISIGLILGALTFIAMIVSVAKGES